MEACKASDDAAPDDGFPVCDSGDSGYTELNPAHHLRVEVVLSLLRQDYSKSWSAATLAKKARLTERQLQAAFKSVYGKTAIRYARKLRLRYAHGLLEQGIYPLRVVCEMVGYPDPSNFSHAFLKEFGYRPGQVQQQKKQ